MATALKVLGQQSPSATTLTDVYTVPAATEAVVSSIMLCNRSATPTTFRIAVRPAGAAIANWHYIAYGVTLGANEPWAITCGITLATTDVVSVYVNDATVSVCIFGQENS